MVREHSGRQLSRAARALPHVQAPISIRYPFVEALTSAMFVARVVVLRPGPLLASRLVFGCALIVLFAIDLEHHLLPNVITLPGIVVGFVFSLFAEPGWVASLIGMRRWAAACCICVAVVVLPGPARGRRSAMGDPKMLAMIGAFLGWKLTLLTLMIASLTGIGRRPGADRGGARQHEVRAAVRLLSRDRRGVWRRRSGPQLLDWYLGFF